VGFNVSAPPTPAPTVTLSTNPTSVAAGGSATLTWSSTNATTCTASGSWSGSQATSGTASVTPTAIGSYTYTLTCTGNGGTASASTMLSANLVTINVTAKSGGGAINWYLSLFLGVFVMLRLMAGLTERRVVAGVIACLIFAAAGTDPARADQTSAVPADSGAFLDQLYLGIRIGGMPVRLDSAKLDQGLTSLGYSDVLANTDTSATAGTLYVGYEFNPAIGVEFGYTHRSATVATLNGTIASTANLTPLLQDTAELIRGYGNIFSLSLRGRLEVAPRFTIDPRIGAFFWDTKVTAQGGGTSVEDTHQGGGVTVGVGAAYRVWRGLELGVGVDYFRGSTNNVATLYAGSLEWRFGH
jgi:PKD repeat protein